MSNRSNSIPSSKDVPNGLIALTMTGMIGAIFPRRRDLEDAVDEQLTVIKESQSVDPEMRTAAQTFRYWHVVTAAVERHWIITGEDTVRYHKTHEVLGPPPPDADTD